MRNYKAAGFVVSLLFVFICFFISPLKISALNPDHVGCSTCHSLHNAPGQALTSDPLGINNLCKSCHGPAGTATIVEVHSGTKYGAFEMGCADCHNAHNNIDNYAGGVNIKQIGHKNGSALITTPNSGENHVVFTSRGTDAAEPSLQSFADGDEDGDGLYEGVCEVCHTQTSHHRNSTSGGDHTHYVGQTCTDCHAHDNFFAGAGGGCTGCHSSSQTGGLVDRRAIVGEFSLTSHHVMAGAVTDDDCAVCHYEVTGDHMDGNVDLLDPDTGGRLTPFASFSRDTTSSSIESWATDVQNNMCMKCHDSDGATATNFSGNALRPFSSGSVDVTNVFDHFSRTSHHAVSTAGTNSYCNSNTMIAPWNTNGDHLISCFDCHGASGHGGANQRMLRSPIDLDSMETGTLDTAIGVQVETFCVLCHNTLTYLTPKTSGYDFSIMEYHGTNQSQHGAVDGNELGCLGCHGGIYNHSGNASNGSALGNIHGTNFDWGTTGVAEGFIVGGWLSDFTYTATSGKCYGGDCNHSGGQGKSYTR